MEMNIIVALVGGMACLVLTADEVIDVAVPPRYRSGLASQQCILSGAG